MTLVPSDEQAARSAFAEWAALQAGAPRDTGALVQDIDVKHEHAGLLSTDIHGRRVVWKSVPASGRTRVTFSSIALETIDPWTADAASLRETSDHVTICESCRGEKKVRCAPCGGTGKLLCDTCRGQRKTYGYAANGSYRLLNCTTCRGKGELDCSECRRGIASCGTCAGEGRLQRWIELEWWRRSVANVHPESLVRLFGWNENVSNEAIARDAELVCDIDKPHRLTPADLGNVSARWVEVLHPPLQTGERVARQRLRIARAATHTVRYRLGGEEDRVLFTGRRLLAPATDALSAFTRRASSLRSLAWLLVIVGVVVAMLSLGRGLFYASIATLFSLIAATAMLFATYHAAAEWTAARRHTRRWAIASFVCLVIFMTCAFAALPRLSHAQKLIASGNLDAAERELHALGDDASAVAWADLRLSRIRQTTDPNAGSAILAKIPRSLPQHTLAAPLVYLPLAKRAIARADWNAAATTIIDARRAGIGASELDPLVAALQSAADDAVTVAERERDPEHRLRLRLSAESMLVTWERASDNWGTPPLIALRTAMARDVAALEKPARRRRR